MTSVRDIIIISVLLLAVGVSIIYAVMIGHRVNEKLLQVPAINNTPEAARVIQKADIAINSTDYLYLALFIGFFLSIIIVGWIVGGTPIMAPIYFFILIIFTFIAVILQMIWIDIAANPTNLSTIAVLPYTNFILSHLGYFTAAMGLVAILVMYAKPSSNGY